MTSIALILLGLAIVIGGVVWLRGHAFVVLTVAAIVVGMLTPSKLVYYDALRQDPSNVAAAEAAANQTIGERVATGFGSTCRKIGILIAMASIIGECLLVSGAAQRIVDAIQQTIGEKRTPLALVASGFVLGIPVFFDTVFFLLIPLARALYSRTGKNYVLYVMSVVVGGTMAHSLVPPTPGPLLVASELGVDLTTAILAGLVVGGIAAMTGHLMAIWLDQRVTPNLTHWAEAPDPVQTPSPAEAGTKTEPSRRPSVFWSLLPIVLPLALLALGTLSRLPQPGQIDTELRLFLLQLGSFIGNKNVALTLSALVAVGLLWWSKPGDGTVTPEAVQRALAAGGTVLLVTAAGGAFGHIIRQTNIAGEVVQWVPIQGTGIALLLIAFSITAVVRAAQGSATVAMITAVSIIAPIVDTIQLPYHPVYAFLAIGCGSKPFPWMNDSGFWVVGRMSGLTPSETLKTFSVILTVMGVAGLVATLIGATLFPMQPTVSMSQGGPPLLFLVP